MSKGSTTDADRPIQSGILGAFAWQGAGRISERFIRFGVNVILARLLSPDDFGTFAAILLPLVALDSITHLACGPFIIQSKRGRRSEHLSTVWLYGVLRGLVLALAVLVLAPFMAAYFERPELTQFFMVAAIQPLLAGAFSPGLFLFERDLQYARVAMNRLVGTTLGAAISLFLAWNDPTPWALLVGQLVGVGMITVGSWFLAPIRPSLVIDSESWQELMAFARGAIGTSVLIMLVSQAPAVLLGRMDSLAALGTFTLAYRLAELPVYLTLTVVGAVLVPAYSRIQNDRALLRSSWLQAWTLIGMYALPISISIAWMGDSLPRVVWGDQFVPGSGLMPLLSLIGFLSALLSVTGPLFWGVGRPGIDRSMQCIRVLIVYAAGVLLVSQYAESGLAWSLACGLVGALGLALPSALKITGSSPVRLARATVPMLIVGTSAFIPLFALDLWSGPQDIARVIWGGSIALGCLLFVSALTFGRLRGTLV